MDVELIEGGSHSDARGSLRFCNDFDMTQVKRFYTISNSAEQPKRGWIMHKRETKWFFPMKGTTTIFVERADESGAQGTARPTTIESVVLESRKPAVLEVPPGNWFLIEQDGNAEVQVFSNCKVGEFPGDDFRREIGQKDSLGSLCSPRLNKEHS